MCFNGGAGKRFSSDPVSRFTAGHGPTALHVAEAYAQAGPFPSTAAMAPAPLLMKIKTPAAEAGGIRPGDCMLLAGGPYVRPAREQHTS